MADSDTNWFEIQRRVVLFKATTTMPDDTQLGYDGNPGSVVNGNTPGETLLYNSPQGTLYQQSNGVMWRKQLMQNTWVELGSSSSETITHVLPRGTWIIDTATAGEREYLAMGSNVWGGDSTYAGLNSGHILVLPYNATVKKILLRGTATQNDTVIVGVHSNINATAFEIDQSLHTLESKFFSPTPLEEVEHTFTDNNSTQVYTFADTTSARTGDTLGISVSGTGPINATNVTVVLEYDKST